MGFQLGDRVKYKAGVQPHLASNIYIVVRREWVNIAGQNTIEVLNEATEEKTFKNPEEFELV
ncbi:hypothetical protein B4Q04_10980 [Zobellia sp. OII3]|uniref:hypothetical protein n=1 Tax=Zobellia sp. OII3 TaxID=2034520 RepID=UPI000B52C2DC|nr:hypothetical protein [Zobellia sp. OII3]OWW25064.1 hypothetical protein B4Q04_10980 [Zobellia sp. OII3]